MLDASTEVASHASHKFACVSVKKMPVCRTGAYRYKKMHRTQAYIRRYRDGAGSNVGNSSVFSLIPMSYSCRQQGHVGSKTLLQQNPPVLNWGAS